MRKKHKKVCRILNYTENLLILVSVVSGCVSISPFVSLVGICIGTMSSAIGLKIHEITPGITKYKLLRKQKEKEASQIVVLVQSKLNNIEVLNAKS